ncbi:hypothetical protein ACQCQP_26470, partial [Ralstonia pseudosolanacearum]|uniref:hypothetical protein n=1 Tax=Ralstonia pseudosolanacearum TaxID=1310165 RepID=UPI003CF0CA19
RTPSVSPEFKIIGGPVSSNSIYATTPIETLPRIANATIGVDVSLFWVLLGSLASDVDRIKIIAMI